MKIIKTYEFQDEYDNKQFRQQLDYAQDLAGVIFSLLHYDGPGRVTLNKKQHKQLIQLIESREIPWEVICGN